MILPARLGVLRVEYPYHSVSQHKLYPSIVLPRVLGFVVDLQEQTPTLALNSHGTKYWHTRSYLELAPSLPETLHGSNKYGKIRQQIILPNKILLQPNTLTPPRHHLMFQVPKTNKINNKMPPVANVPMLMEPQNNKRHCKQFIQNTMEHTKF